MRDLRVLALLLIVLGPGTVLSSFASQPVALLVEDLYSPVQATASAAKLELLRVSRSSPQSRTEVVGRLLGVLDDPRAQEIRYSRAWYASAEILGDLRAEEAIEPLVRHLDYSNGVTGLSVSNLPAVSALIKIGKAAVPALSVALTDSTPSKRLAAARALGGIGGADSSAALKAASKAEQDKTVQFYIAQALKRTKQN